MKTLKERQRAAAEASRRWRERHPDQAKKVGRDAYHRRLAQLGIKSTARKKRTAEEKREADRVRSKAWRERYPEKARAARKRHYDRNREAHIAKVVKWAKDNPDRHKATLMRTALRRLYGITPEQYAALGSACAICGASEDNRTRNGKPFRLAVDHCHDTKRIRGLLCGNCNCAIGYFKHDLGLLLKAVEYLKRE